MKGRFNVCLLTSVLIVDQVLWANSFVAGVGSLPIKQSANSFTKKTTALSLSANKDVGGGDNGSGGIGVGIDLGTTNSAIAYLDPIHNTPKIVEIPKNGRTMKSVVGPVFVDDDEPMTVVGNDAIEWEYDNHISAYRHFKRVMGTGSTFLSSEVVDVVPHVVRNKLLDVGVGSNKKNKKGQKNKKKNKKNKPPSLIRLMEDAKTNPVELEGLIEKTKIVSPEQISSQILQKLIRECEESTQQTITRAVIGVPAYFNDAQRDATVKAANLAGIEKVKLLREPEAAALAYGNLDGKNIKESPDDYDLEEEEEFVLVFDLGGGTYDVSILLIEKGLTEIVCTAGDAKLGGSNFDYKIAKHLSTITKGCGRRNEQCFDKMVRTAELIRIFLSNNRVAQLVLPTRDDDWIAMDDPSSVLLPHSKDMSDELELGTNYKETHLHYEFTRMEMEKVCINELTQLLRPLREVAVLSGALLPGDASPTIVESAIEMETVYAGEEFYAEDDIDSNPSEEKEIAKDFKQAKKMQQKGRKKARQTAKKERKYRDESRKASESPQSMASEGTKVRGEGIAGRPISRVVLVGGATRMPAIGRIIAALTGVVPQKTVDPDEAVALGCAVHVGVLDGKEEMGTVLSPMQAALLRAVVEKQKRDGMLDDMMYEDDDDDFY